uniref:Tektin n=2 Tax=Schistosoma mansoni TaxID=6183 RepID=A0A3Q0KRJ8_SCHMA
MVSSSYFTPSPIVRSKSSMNILTSPNKNNEKSRGLTQIWPCNVQLSRYQSLEHPSNYYNYARKCIYPRHSETMWNLVNKAALQNAAHERAEAEELRLQSWQKIQQVNRQTRIRQAEATNKLRERVEEINHWKNELKTEIHLNEEEQERLKTNIQLLNYNKDYIRKPLEIAEECLANREQRHGIDEVKDIVERALSKEVQTVNKGIDLITKLVDKAEIQLKLLRSTQNELQKDAVDKDHAQTIDDRLHGLCNSSANIALYNGIEYFDNTRSIPTSWMRYTQENLIRSQNQRSASENLREKIDSALRSLIGSVHGQFVTVNNALQTRINEVANARDNLRLSLRKVTQELYEVENLIGALKKTTDDKIQPLKVAQTRLKERTRRINVESCYDQPMKTLQTEVLELRKTIEELKNNRRNANITLARLQKSRTSLEQEIETKENSLSIDQRCLSMRKSFPIKDKYGSLYAIPVSY